MMNTLAPVLTACLSHTHLHICGGSSASAAPFLRLLPRRNETCSLLPLDSLLQRLKNVCSDEF